MVVIIIVIVVIIVFLLVCLLCLLVLGQGPEGLLEEPLLFLVLGLLHLELLLPVHVAVGADRDLLLIILITCFIIAFAYYY